MSDGRDINDLHRDGDLPEALDDGAVEFGAWETQNSEAELVEQAKHILPVASAHEVAAAAEQEPDWIIEGIVARGQVTVVAGSPKAGKSTLFSAASCAACSGAEQFAGFPIRGGSIGVLWLYEDPKATVGRRLRALDAPARFHTIGFREAARQGGLAKVSPEVLAGMVIALAASLGLDLVVFDTLRRWFRIDEKSEEQADLVIGALQGAAEAYGIAVIVIHHARKRGQGIRPSARMTIDDVRGTSAIAGAADAVVLLNRPDRASPDAPIQLSGEGREEAHNFSCVLERDRSTGVCRRGADERALRVEKAKLALLAAVRADHGDTGSPVSRNRAAVRAREGGASIPNDQITPALEALVAEERLEKREGGYVPGGDDAQAR
jgi:hypothetical protein